MLFPLFVLLPLQLALAASYTSDVNPLGSMGGLGALQFVETDVPYNSDPILAQSFRPYYYSQVSLLAYNRIYMIKQSTNASLCLTFVNVSTSGSFIPGLPLSFTPCTYNATTSQPTSKLQLLKAIRQCNSTGAYIFQMWVTESGSQDTFAFLSAPDSTIPCLSWNSSTSLAVQMPCSYDTSQQWLLSSPIPTTQDVCPATPEASFSASNPIAIMSQLTALLQCPSASQISWSAAAATITANSILNATAIAASLPSCFNINLIEIEAYDGGFVQSAFYIGGQDPFLSLNNMSMFDAVNAISQTVFDPATSGWNQGTSLTFWFRALDVTLNQASTYLSSSQLASISNDTLSYPLSLLSSADYFAITCSPGSNNFAPTTLPDGFFNPFKVGIRNILIQGCSVTGQMPTTWPSIYPLATGRYLNQYPVKLSFKNNLIEGALPVSYLEWTNCWVSQLDLSFNNLSFSLGMDDANSICFSQTTSTNICGYFNSISRSTSVFGRHIDFASGPHNSTALQTCGLVTTSLGFSPGISWLPSSLQSNRLFVFSWQWSLDSDSPYQDCSIDNSCDLSTASFSVRAVSVAPVPLTLLLTGNPDIGLAFSSGWTGSSTAAFVTAICDKKVLFGDRTRNLCAKYSPHPTLEILWGITASIAVVCALVGWKVRRSMLSKIADAEVAKSRKMRRRSTENAAELALAAHLEYTKSLERGEITPEAAMELLRVTSIRKLKRSDDLVNGLAGAAFFSVHVDLNKTLVKAQTRAGDWMERNRFRIKFIVQSAIAAYTLGWGIPLVAQSWAQNQLCSATDLCPRAIFPLMVLALITPGIIVLALIAFFFLRGWLDKRTSEASQSATLQRFMVVTGIVIALPLIFLFGAMFGGPIWVWIFISWILIWWWPWLDQHLWGVLCLLSCITVFTSNIPIAVLVTILFTDGYDVSVKNEESNALVFVGNMAGQAFAIGTFAISFFMRQDIWRCLFRLLRDNQETPWYFYEEERAAARYKERFPMWIKSGEEDNESTLPQDLPPSDSDDPMRFSDPAPARRQLGKFKSIPKAADADERGNDRATGLDVLPMQSMTIAADEPTKQEKALQGAPEAADVAVGEEGPGASEPSLT